jgi:hypothetical protein
MIYNILSFDFDCRNPHNAHARTFYKCLKHNKVTKSPNEKQIFRKENGPTTPFG